MPHCSSVWQRLQEAAGQHDEAAATLERLNYIYPVKDEELHRQLGDLLFAQKQYDGAVREYSAVVASNPIDKAGAEFNLAQAYIAAGQKDKAQESVLAALETAPGYRPAQKLLLELQESRQRPTDKDGNWMASVSELNRGRSTTPAAHRAISRRARGHSEAGPAGDRRPAGSAGPDADRAVCRRPLPDDGHARHGEDADGAHHRRGAGAASSGASSSLPT